MKTLIKTADVFGNVHYLMRGEHGWSAALANGIPYCFHQAANAYEPDEVALKFELDNTTTAEEAIEVLQRRGKRPAGQWQPTFEIMSGASVRVPDEIAAAWPDAPLPTVVVPAPDDPRYGQVFDLMLNICEGLKDARDFESTGDLNMAEGVWDEQINPKLDEVFALLAPETPDGHPAA